MIDRVTMIKEILDFTSKYKEEYLGRLSDLELIGLHADIMIKKSGKEARKRLGLKPSKLYNSINWGI